MRYREEEVNLDGMSIGLALGDITAADADAYIVPQFESGASEGGVGGAICRAGAERGVIDEYETRVKANGGTLEFGTAFVTPAHGGRSRKLIHAVSVGSGKEKEFRTIQKAVFNALLAAQQDGTIKTVVCPVLGTGIIGSLSDRQSATAMLSAVSQFNRQHPDSGIKVSFVAFANPASTDNPTMAAFKDVIAAGEYKEGAPTVGSRKFDAQRFVDAMNDDAAANAAAGVGTTVATPHAPLATNVTVTTDVVVSGVGRTWVSDPRAEKATQNRMALVHPDDAPAVLEALDKHISGIYRPITYKLAEVDVNGRKLIAIGSADPSFYLGIGESHLIQTSLQEQGIIKNKVLLGGINPSEPRDAAQIAKAAHLVYPADEELQRLARPEATPKVTLQVKRGFGS